MADIKKNFAYKGILTFSNYILGFITLPYITRVLGPDKFGEVNFVMNTVDYFLLFASMGIVVIGTRETARFKENQKELSAAVSSIFYLNLVFTFVVLMFYNISIFLFHDFYRYKELFWIGNAKILFGALIMEWFFTGLENFRYITIRSVAIKLVYILLVFLTVRTTSDYKLYFILTILSYALNAFINFVYTRRFVRIDHRNLKLKKYLSSNLKLGFFSIMTSMYLTFNVMYLGLVSNMDEVGYYTTSLKLYFVILSMFSAFTSVMMPRMASVVSSGEEIKFNSYLRNSYNIVFLFAFPVTAMSIILAPEIIDIVAGNGYGPSVTPMRILMCALTLVCLAQVISVQGLAVLKKDNILVCGSLTGAILSLILNFILTAKMGAVGSAVVLLASETSVTLFYVCKVAHSRLFPLPSVKMLVKNVAWTIPFVLLAFSSNLVSNSFLALGIVAVGCMIIVGVAMKKRWLPVESN